MVKFSNFILLTPDFFSRALFSPLSSQHLQTYYSLTVYFFLAFALCGLLAGLAYLFSISTAQETEKRSEYECGFAPFDSATRLPFDVHFYLVGILFLIFDVEVALLFPWVLALRTTGWFSFYLMLAFLAILSLGFLYEWKRGALIWPTRYSKKNFSPIAWLIAAAQGETAHELFEILTNWPALLFVAVFILHRLALLYTFVQKSKRASRDQALKVLWVTAVAIFFTSLFYSYYLSLALAVVFFVSSYLESNPFWPARAYWWARVLLFSFPSRFEKRPYRALRRIWGSVLFLFILWGVGAAYNFLVPVDFMHVPWYKLPLINEIIFTSPEETLLRRGWNYSVYLFYRWTSLTPFLLTLPALHVLGTPFVVFARLLDEASLHISMFDTLALLLVFWMVASTLTSYAYGGTNFIIGGNLYQKKAGDPSIKENMRYLWTELIFLAAVSILAAFLYLVDWDLFSSVANALVISARMEAIDDFSDLIVRLQSAPADILDLLHRARLYITGVAAALATVLAKLWTDLKTVPALMWRFKPVVLWLIFIIRGYYYHEYMHWQETRSFYGKVVYTISSLLYTYVMPLIAFYHFTINAYNQVLALVTSYYAKYKGTVPVEKQAQLTGKSDGSTSGDKTLSVIGAIIIVDRTGAPTGLDPQAVVQSALAAQERMASLMNEVASAQIVYQDLVSVTDMLVFMVICLFMRLIHLAIRWFTRQPIPTDTPAELVKQFAWAPRKASLWGWFFPQAVPVKIEDTYLCINILDDFAECNAQLSEELTVANEKIAAICPTIASLSVCCAALFVANCLLSRQCQHHYQQLNGILTYGALTVIPEPKASRSASKAAPFTLVVGAADLLSPTHAEFAGSQLAGFPLLAETLLFLLICGVITKLSLALGKEHNKHSLAFSSWRLLSVGLFSVVFIYAYQFTFDCGSATILSGYFATSRTITFLKLITLLSAVFVLDASETFMRQHSRHLLEYPIMVALTTLFMLLLVSANHIMSTFLSLVGFSLGLYVLILYDANKRPSREAGLKYYYLSTLSSGFILYGILLIYTLTGTGNFDELFLLFNTKAQFQENTLLRTALLLILAGFFFKLSAFPGHLWAADVYEGSPAPVTAFFMLPVKIVVLGAFIRLFSVALAPLATYWLPLLTVAVIISIVWGAFASVQEKKIRRFLAYASINQMGFLLMGFTTDSDEGYQAALLYIAVYAVMTCAFLTIFLSARRQDGSELLYVSDFRTLANRNWLVGWSLAIVLFSMAGIPPLGGFFAKYLVLLHAFEKNLIAEVIVGLATSLISTYYYLRIIKILKFEQPDGAMPSSPCLTPRRQSQLFLAEAVLWTFVLFAPAILSITYALAFTQGPACLVF